MTSSRRDSVAYIISRDESVTGTTGTCVGNFLNIGNDQSRNETKPPSRCLILNQGRTMSLSFMAHIF